jgi:hypothetical protein
MANYVETWMIITDFMMHAKDSHEYYRETIYEMGTWYFGAT